MPNHPNRSRSSPAGNPAPQDIRRAREAEGLTQTQAAALVRASLRNWQQWEADPGTINHRRMHPGLWDLFRIRVGVLDPAAIDS